jgi:PAS domain S-box-containing protein
MPIPGPWTDTIPPHSASLVADSEPVRVSEGWADSLVAAALTLAVAFVLWRNRVRAVAQRREAERLRHDAEFFCRLFDHAAETTLVYDADYRIVEANERACRELGYERRELIGVRVRDVAPALDPTRSRPPAPGTIRGELRHKDGTMFPVETRVAVAEVTGRTYHLAHSRGTSAEKQLEADLHRVESQLRQSQKMEGVGRLAGGIAHDFNNLLTIINGYSELLAQRLPKGPNRDMIVEMGRAGERAAELTRQLLAYSRKQILQTRVFDLNAAVADQARMLRRLIGEDITMTLDLSARHARVCADPGQTEQVLMNLTVNARDAMPRGGTLTVRTADLSFEDLPSDIDASVRPGPFVLLEVSDTGTGMPPEVRSRVFEPFFTTKGVGKGTGLGLATVQGVVRQHGGHVAVESEPGRGSTFRVYLPRIVTEAGPAAAHDRPAPKAPRGQGTVLLAEDEEGVRRLTRAILESNGYEVLEAPDGASALEVVYRHPGAVDLLVSDVIMPGMNGAELAKAVRSIRPDLRVLLMSGYTEESLFRRGGDTVREEVLNKPFTPEELARRVSELMRRPA